MTETDPLANTRTIVYNNLGLPVSETDKNGVTSQYSYDALLRIASISKGSEEVSYSYDMAGNLTQMQDNEGTTNYTYDYCGNQLSQSRGGTILSYTYDDIGNCITMSSSANNGASTQSAAYRYSIKGNLTQAEHGLFKGVYVYDDNGNIKRSTVYYSTSSVNIEMYTYNVGNLPIKRTRGGQTTNIYYNLDGSISRINGGGENSEFVYDKAGRLITEEKDGETTTYTYDKRGNRLSKTNADESITYVYDLNNRLISSTKVTGDSTETTTYTYDANGNLIQKQSPNESITYSYNPMGTLASVANNTTQTTAYYTYDGNGLRQSKRVVTAPDNEVTTQFVNDRGNVIEEITDGVSTKYSRGRRILGVQDGTTYAYYLYNMHGDVESVIRKTNSYVLDKYDYDAFGNCSAEYARMNSPFRYCGEYYDDESGLIYLRNRYYDPSKGRFITEDSAKDGLNWYVYCGNDPVNRIDPTGESWKDTVYGLAQAIDQNNYGGFIEKLSDKISGDLII